MPEEIILNERQLRCLASPALRQALSALRGLGEASATKLAAKIGRSPATALYHLRRLESVGLARIVDRRATARRPEAIYTPAARAFTLPGEAPQIEGLVTKAVLAGVREAMRGFAVATGRKHKHVLRCQLRLSDEDVGRFLELLESANRFGLEHKIAEGGVCLQWSSIVFPEG